MPGRAKSNTKKTQLAREERDTLYARAVELYHNEQEKPSKERMGLRKVCDEISRLHVLETGRRVDLSFVTLQRLANGGVSLTKFNATKSWLTADETEVLVSLIEEMGERGFPFDHVDIKNHTDEICKARLGKAFPNVGVGEKWTNRFVEKHSSRIQGYFTTGLESVRGQAVNINTHRAWFDVLDKHMKKYNVEPDCLYGFDETGFMPGRGTRSRAFGKAGKGTQHKQESGKRENITALVTICADGTSIPPLVIFKGKSYLAQWVQDNPLNCSCVSIHK